MFPHGCDHLFYFNKVETAEEFDLSMSLFFEYLHSDAVTIPLGTDEVIKIHNFVVNTLLPCHSFWASFVRHEIPCLNTITTNAAEQMNSSTKCGFLSVLPCMGIDVATEQMIAKSHVRYCQKRMQNMKAKVSSKLWTASKTKDILTTYAETVMTKTFDRVDLYAVVRSTIVDKVVQYIPSFHKLPLNSDTFCLSFFLCKIRE